MKRKEKVYSTLGSCRNRKTINNLRVKVNTPTPSPIFFLFFCWHVGHVFLIQSKLITNLLYLAIGFLFLFRNKYTIFILESSVLSCEFWSGYFYLILLYNQP